MKTQEEINEMQEENNRLHDEIDRRVRQTELNERGYEAACLDHSPPPELTVPETTRAEGDTTVIVNPAVMKEWWDLSINLAAWALRIQENVEAAQLNRDRLYWPISLVQGRLALELAREANRAAREYKLYQCNTLYVKSKELYNVFLKHCTEVEGMMSERKKTKAA
jgi:hypothetical protein